VVSDLECLNAFALHQSLAQCLSFNDSWRSSTWSCAPPSSTTESDGCGCRIIFRPFVRSLDTGSISLWQCFAGGRNKTGWFKNTNISTLWRNLLSLPSLRYSSKLYCSAVAFIICILACSAVASAQTKPLDDQPWDYGFWAGGGFSVPGGTKDTQAMNAGVRLGKVLTDDIGASFFRGNFEWSADLIPFYYFWQPAPHKNAFGEGFNAVNLKWNFTSSPRIVPFAELGGGVLFTNHAVPANSSHVNFLTHATLGFQFFNNDRRALTANVLFQHISNAGLTVPNPGINTVQFQMAVNWFK